MVAVVERLLCDNGFHLAAILLSSKNDGVKSTQMSFRAIYTNSMNRFRAAGFFRVYLTKRNQAALRA